MVFKTTYNSLEIISLIEEVNIMQITVRDPGSALTHSIAMMMALVGFFFSETNWGLYGL